MNVLVDTAVWSLALRRAKTPSSPIVSELRELVRENRVEIIGPIRQELLSGVKVDSQFQLLRQQLEAFHDIPLESVDFETAATCYNQCRAAGIQGSNTDFLICAVAKRRELTIFTDDADFTAFQRVLSLRLHAARG